MEYKKSKHTLSYFGNDSVFNLGISWLSDLLVSNNLYVHIFILVGEHALGACGVDK